MCGPSSNGGEPWDHRPALGEGRPLGGPGLVRGSRPGLGDDFRAAIDGLLRRVSEFPLAFPQVHRGIRRAGVRRFPYLVYYSVTPDAVIVVACLHSRRDPALLKSRL